MMFSDPIRAHWNGEQVLALGVVQIQRADKTLRTGLLVVQSDGSLANAEISEVSLDWRYDKERDAWDDLRPDAIST